MKRLIIIALLAIPAFGQTKDRPQPTTQAGNAATKVFVTANGKKYHTWRDCARLDRSTVLVTDEATAEMHGLTLCSICAHRAHVDNKSQGPKGTNAGWAKAEGK